MFQEVNNSTHRWLLPFTSDVDLPTIEAALRLAETGGATLVAVSFVATPSERRSQAVRLELIQQSKDFLEACHYKALRLSIPVECYEVYTRDVLGSIATQLHDLECESLVLASRGQKMLLLHEAEVRQLLLRPPVALVFLRFPQRARRDSRSRLRAPLFSWLQRASNSLWNGRQSGSSDLGREQSQQTTLSPEPSSLVFVRGRAPGGEVEMQKQREE